MPDKWNAQFFEPSEDVFPCMTPAVIKVRKFQTIAQVLRSGYCCPLQFCLADFFDKTWVFPWFMFDLAVGFGFLLVSTFTLVFCSFGRWLALVAFSLWVQLLLGLQIGHLHFLKVRLVPLRFLHHHQFLSEVWNKLLTSKQDSWFHAQWCCGNLTRFPFHLCRPGSPPSFALTPFVGRSRPCLLCEWRVMNPPSRKPGVWSLSFSYHLFLLSHLLVLRKI